MSFTVMAGTSQMVALDIWAQPLPLIALAVSVFVANLRYFVMGAALQPHLPHLPWWQQPAVWYATVDQNWALNIAEYRRGQGDLGKFLGGGFVMACIWSGSTLAGNLAAGGVLSDPTTRAYRLGLDFVGIAVFVVVAAIMFRGKSRPRALGGRDRRGARRAMADRRQLVHRDRRPGRRPLRRAPGHAGSAMSANPETLIAILVMALAAMAAKGGGFLAMRWLGRHRFIVARARSRAGRRAGVGRGRAAHAIGRRLHRRRSGGAVVTRTAGGFTPGLFAAVGAVALARWAGLP